MFNSSLCKKIALSLVLVFLLYCVIAIGFMAFARVHELISYQLVGFKGVVSGKVLPVPFGGDLAKWFLTQKSKEEISKIFLYDVFLMPKELAVEGQEQGYSVGSHAVAKSFSVASLLIKLGLDVDSENRYGCTSLQLAIEDENLPVVSFLVRHSASLMIFDENASWEFCRLSSIQLADKKGIELAVE